MLALLLIVLMQDAPRVLLDQSPRAVEYQLARLSNDQLVKVERRETDDKYRPVYAAIMARKGMARPLRAEALAALVRMERASQGGRDAPACDAADITKLHEAHGRFSTVCASLTR